MQIASGNHGPCFSDRLDGYYGPCFSDLLQQLRGALQRISVILNSDPTNEALFSTLLDMEAEMVCLRSMDPKAANPVQRLSTCLHGIRPRPGSTNNELWKMCQCASDVWTVGLERIWRRRLASICECIRDAYELVAVTWVVSCWKLKLGILQPLYRLRATQISRACAGRELLQAALCQGL